MGYPLRATKQHSIDSQAMGVTQTPCMPTLNSHGLTSEASSVDKNSLDDLKAVLSIIIFLGYRE
jgi:hypothetical protein